MATYGLCEKDQDPSKVFPNPPPPPRQAYWLDAEVKVLVEKAREMGYLGLAATLAVAWDSQLSPVDARTLTLAQRLKDARGSYFPVDAVGDCDAHALV